MSSAESSIVLPSPTHCYVTGPLFLLAAVYAALSAFGIVSLHPNRSSGEEAPGTIRSPVTAGVEWQRGRRWRRDRWWFCKSRQWRVSRLGVL